MYGICNLCQRKCKVNRLSGQIGYCKMGSRPCVAYSSLHKWEEPPISGERGSGAIFFSGCSLGCIYCQNREISRGRVGKEMTDSELSSLMLSLESMGAHNINFVTPTHFIPSVVSATAEARAAGLKIPTVYNTAAYESPEALELLYETVDIWLPDLKYYKSATAEKYSKAPDLPKIAFDNIERMVKHTRRPVFDGQGIMQKGVIVRLLLLPGSVAEAKLNLSRLHRAFGDDIYISLMSQYTPLSDMPAPLNRRVTHGEYEELVDYAVSLGVKNAFVQDYSSAEESFIPDFLGKNN